MKLFQTIRGYLAIMGIEPSRQCKNYSFNFSSLVILTTLVHFTAATAAFILYDAESFKEVADSFYASSASLSAVLNLIETICNSSRFFALIEGFENTIESSKKTIFLIVRIGIKRVKYKIIVIKFVKLFFFHGQDWKIPYQKPSTKKRINKSKDGAKFWTK